MKCVYKSVSGWMPDSLAQTVGVVKIKKKNAKEVRCVLCTQAAAETT